MCAVDFFLLLWFLADHANGHAFGTVLRLSVVCDVMYCGYMVRPTAKVTIESL